MSHYDIIISIDVADWRDVPIDDARRTEMLKDIADDARFYAERTAEDKYDIVLKPRIEIKGVKL